MTMIESTQLNLVIESQYKQIVSLSGFLDRYYRQHLDTAFMNKRARCDCTICRDAISWLTEHWDDATIAKVTDMMVSEPRIK